MKKFSFIASLGEAINTLQHDLRQSNTTDAGSQDIESKAGVVKDVKFNSLRNSINSNGNLSGSEIADYITRAEEINDEIDTVVYGVETDSGAVIKIYVNAEQDDDFEEALSNMLGLDEDIETALNALTKDFDIVDIVWPDGEGPASDEEDTDTGNADPDAEIKSALDKPESDNNDSPEDEDFEITAATPPDSDDVDADLESDDLPPVDDTGETGSEEPTPWMTYNERLINLSLESEPTYDDIAKIIDIEKADQLAVEQFDAADFMSLDSDEQEDIINANADLLIDVIETKDSEDSNANDDSENSKKEKEQPVKESFSLRSFLNS